MTRVSFSPPPRGVQKHAKSDSNLMRGSGAQRTPTRSKSERFAMGGEPRGLPPITPPSHRKKKGDPLGKMTTASLQRSAMRSATAADLRVKDTMRHSPVSVQRSLREQLASVTVLMREPNREYEPPRLSKRGGRVVGETLAVEHLSDRALERGSVADLLCCYRARPCICPASRAPPHPVVDLYSVVAVLNTRKH